MLDKILVYHSYRGKQIEVDIQICCNNRLDWVYEHIFRFGNLVLEDSHTALYIFAVQVAHHIRYMHPVHCGTVRL